MYRKVTRETLRNQGLIFDDLNFSAFKKVLLEFDSLEMT